MVWATDKDVADLAKRTDAMRWSGDYVSEYRKVDRLASVMGGISAEDTLQLDLTTLDVGTLESVQATIKNLGGTIQASMTRHVTNETMGMVIYQIEIAAAQVDALLQIPTLVYLDVTPVYDIQDERSNQIMADNFDALGDTVTGYNAWINNTGFDGDGVTVAIVDTGVDWDHPDLNVVSGTEYGGYSETNEPGSDGAQDLINDGRGSGHGTHVAGIVAGDGSSGDDDSDGFLYGQGVAPSASLHAMDPISEDNSTTRQQMFIDSSTNSDLSNNSWGAGSGGSGYTSSAADHDDWVIDSSAGSPSTPFLSVFAAGNSSSSGLTDPSEAKNLLVVGSSDSERLDIFGSTNGNINNISSFSSRGPTVDGRIKTRCGRTGGLYRKRP